jgi:hypothetical protein
MAGFTNPALAEFIRQLDDGMTFVQVRITPRADGFDLRHVVDAGALEASLSTLEIAALRPLAQTTTEGAFRPNKAAPDLRPGWRATARDASELETALRLLYPGGAADWFAARSPKPPITDYREFTARQTGLYRITQILPDTLAAQAVKACCDARFCLRRRLWTVAGLAPDPAVAKSALPCLEPCALLLDLARRAMKLEQEPKTHPALAESEVPTVLAALEVALAHPRRDVREGDSTNAANPRRFQLLYEKLRRPSPGEEAKAD